MISELVKKYTDQYCLQVDGVKFWTPYYRTAQVKDDKKVQDIEGPFAGKGSPEELIEVLNQALEDSQSRPKDPEEFRIFMKEHKIGVECSGFIFNVMSGVLRDLNKGELAEYIYWSKEELLQAFDKGIPWHKPELERALVESYSDCVSLSQLCADWGWKEPRRMVRADRFWSPNTSVALSSINDLGAGDFVTMREVGSQIGHIFVVSEVSDSKITYAHANRLDGTIGGVHYASIGITDSSKPIELQDWEETDFLNTHYSYGIYRLRVLADA